MTFSPLNLTLFGILGLLGIGFYGLLASCNLIKVIIALQILAKAAILGLVAAGNANGQVNLGQNLAITVIVADTVVAVIGMALAVQIRHRVGTLDIDRLSSLRG